MTNTGTILFWAGYLIGMVGGTIIHRAPINNNQNYVNPRAVEWIVEDKDSNKMKETYVKINGKDYLFKIKNGQPKIVPYEIKKTSETVTSNIEKIVIQEAK